MNNKSQLSESDLTAWVDIHRPEREGGAPLFVSITASYLAFYYYEKQLTFQETVSLKHRQKSILEMFYMS